MQKKSRRIQPKNRNRQKLSQRYLMLLAVSGLSCMVVAVLIFINSSRVDHSKAAVQTYVVVDADPVTEKTLDKIYLKPEAAIGPNTILVRPIKSEKNPVNDAQE